MTTVAPTFREPALPEKSNNNEGSTKPSMRLGALSAGSLLDFPPGASPSPLPTIEQTPNRFLAACAAKLDQEPNPFENTFKQVASGGPIPEPPSGSGFSLSPKPVLPPLTPSPRFMGAFDGASYPFASKTGFTPGGGLTPFSAAIKAMTAESELPIPSSTVDSSTSGPSPMIPASTEPVPPPHLHHQDPQNHYQFPPPPSQQSQPPASAASTSSQPPAPYPPYPLHHQHTDPGVYPISHHPYHHAMGPRGPLHGPYAQGRTASGYPLPVPPPTGVDPMLTQPPPPVAPYPPLEDSAAAAAVGLQLLSGGHGGKADMMRRQSIEAQRGGWPGMVDEENVSSGAPSVSPKQSKRKGSDEGANETKNSKKRARGDDDEGAETKAKANGSAKKGRSRKKSQETGKKGGDAKADTNGNGVMTNGNGMANGGSPVEGRGTSDAGVNGGEFKGPGSSVGDMSDDDDEGRGQRSGSRAKDDDDDPDEKRKSFLERNRQAALKCRQKKKQWLQSLQQKVEFLTSDNETLQNQATQLREEILNLKTLLLAHKDCPIANNNGLNLAAIEASLPFPTHPQMHGGPGGPPMPPGPHPPGPVGVPPGPPHPGMVGGYPVHGLRGY
ncbi:hypothetical protein HDV00_002720 [Rhizophlyctis rosea]|nr:hypothetical protein HDV00_002720 [Rhizophlyctis rosea]